MVLALAAVGCERAEPGGGSATQPGEAAANKRLVTLAPALTKAVVDLGAGDRLVGVAKNDAAAPDDVPVVGTFTNVNIEALLEARPTHVLTMTAKEGPPDRLRSMAEAGRFKLVTYSYPRTIEEALAILHRAEGAGGGASASVGRVIERTEQAARHRQRIETTLAQLKQLTRSWPKPEALLVIGTNPLRITGPGSVNDELLDYVGARNVVADASIPALSLNREALLARQPEAIVMLAPGGPPLRENDQRLSVFKDLAIPAVRHDRIALLNDPFIQLPSTTLDQTAIALAQAIHPDRAEAIDRAIAEAPSQATQPARSR
jgi:ABC-type hemin transport system substrate-binding protein